MKAVAPGFKTWTVPEVALAIGDRLRQDFRLDVGALDQSMEVTASSPALQTDSSSLSNLINTNALQDLPLTGVISSSWRSLRLAQPRESRLGCPAVPARMTAA